MRLGGQGIAQKKSPYVNILLYPKENFNDRKTALGIPEILYNVIYSRPRVARTAAASNATGGRGQHERRPRVADFFLASRMTLALRTAI